MVKSFLLENGLGRWHVLILFSFFWGVGVGVEEETRWGGKGLLRWSMFCVDSQWYSRVDKLSR